MVSAINGDTPLELAVQKDDIERVKILINSGADIHVTDEYGDTLLDRALFTDRIEIAELLKSKGAKAPNYEEEQNQMDQYRSRKSENQQIFGFVFLGLFGSLVIISMLLGRRGSGGSGCGSGCGGCGGGGGGGGCGGGD